MNDEDNKIGGFAIGLIENASPTVKIFPVAIKENKVFHDFAFKSLAGGDLLITGIISDTLPKGKDSSLLQASYFIKRITAGTLQTKYEVVQDFKLEAKIALGKAKRGTTFKNTEIVEMNDELYVVTQHTDIMIKPSNSDMFNFMNAQFTNREIIVSKVGNDGTIAWTKVIPKLLIGGLLIDGVPKPPRYSGNYKTFVAGNKLNFVFLDNPDTEIVRWSSSDPCLNIPTIPPFFESVFMRDNPSHDPSVGSPKLGKSCRKRS